jgi:uncharacterized ion transporter superfamily protein YfcC
MKHHFDKSKDTKTIISFLIVLLAFSCLLLFYRYHDTILSTGYFNLFMTLVFIAMGLFVGLLFLLSKEPKSVRAKVTKSKKKR